MAILITFLAICFWFLPFVCCNAYYLVEEKLFGVKRDRKRIFLTILPIVNIWNCIKLYFYENYCEDSTENNEIIKHKNIE